MKLEERRGSWARWEEELEIMHKREKKKKKEELKEGVQLRTLSSQHPTASAKILPWKNYKSTFSHANAFLQICIHTTLWRAHKHKRSGRWKSNGRRLREGKQGNERFKSLTFIQISGKHVTFYDYYKTMHCSTGGPSQASLLGSLSASYTH